MMTSNIEVVPSILLVSRIMLISSVLQKDIEIAADALSNALNVNCEMHLDSSKPFTDLNINEEISTNVPRTSSPLP